MCVSVCVCGWGGGGGGVLQLVHALGGNAVFSPQKILESEFPEMAVQAVTSIYLLHFTLF